MQKVRVLFFCLTILASLAASAPLLASGGYDKLYWIDIKGNCLHNTPDQGVVITSFMRYRQYSQDGDGVKPGYFQCIRNGMDMQISVREIKQIRLKQSPDSFKQILGDEKLKELILIMRDGRSFDVSVTQNMGHSLANHPYIELQYYNPVTREYEYGGFAGNTIRQITFE